MSLGDGFWDDRFSAENRSLRKGVIKMNLHLRKWALLVAVLALLEGCAFYVRGHGEYYQDYPHHYHHYGYWR